MWRILYADQDKDSLEVLKVAFETVDADLHVDCLDRMEYLEQVIGPKLWDAYLIDLDFNDTGIDLCRQIRSLDPQGPVLFLTSYALETQRLEALNAGARGYFSKPLDLEGLRMTIRELLNEK
jgi:DNA-binding response OmpR family regulator